MLFEQESQSYRQALNKAMDYLSMRAYSSNELYQKLCQKLEDKPAAAAAVARCVELGMLDDEAFARQRAAQLVARGKSPMQIRAYLMEKGVERSVAQQVLEELQEEHDPVESILGLIQRQYARKLEQGKQQAVIAALARRGFSLRDIRRALESWDMEQQELDFSGWDEF